MVGVRRGATRARSATGSAGIATVGRAVGCLGAARVLVQVVAAAGSGVAIRVGAHTTGAIPEVGIRLIIGRAAAILF